MIYGNYRTDEGEVLVRDGDEMVDVAHAAPRRILALRRRVMGYVSQFLRVIPRVGAFDIVRRRGGGKRRQSGPMRKIAPRACSPS